MEERPKQSALDRIRAESTLLIGLIVVAGLATLVVADKLAYLVYHSVAEMTVAAIALATFTVAWHARRLVDDDYLTMIGITQLYVAAVTILHVLTYKGMNIIPNTDVTTASQFWLITRGIQAAGLVIAPYFIGRRMKHPLAVFGAMGTATGAAVLATFVGWMPITFTEGRGLTTFKVDSEYVIMIAMVVGLYLLWRKRDGLASPVRRDMYAAIACMIAAEASFSFYTDVYDVFNTAGHVLHLASFYFIYRALVARSLEDPFSVLFRELRAREESLRESHRLSEGINDIASAINATLSVNSIMSAAVVEAARITGADAAILSLRDDAGTFEVKYAHGYADSDIVGVPLTTDEAPHLYLATTTNEPVVIADTRTDDRAGNAVQRFGLRSLLSVPLVTQGRPAGVLSFHWWSLAPSVESPHLQLFAQKLASALSLALQNAHRYESEHRVAETLQSAMTEPPGSVAGFDIGHVYRPARGVGRIGGDFYDVFALRDGRVGFLLGDVSGKGIEAAAMSTKTRSTMRALAHAQADPASVLRDANSALATQLGDGEFVTVAYGVIDPATLDVAIGLAGHPEPIICSRPEVHPHDAERNPPLGVIPDIDFHTWHFTMAPTDTIVLFSDGVFEARNTDEFFGMPRVQELLHACGHIGPQDLADSLLAAVEQFAGDDLRDDTAVLAIKASHAPSDAETRA